MMPHCALNSGVVPLRTRRLLQGFSFINRAGIQGKRSAPAVFSCSHRGLGLGSAGVSPPLAGWVLAVFSALSAQMSRRHMGWDRSALLLHSTNFPDC